MKKEILLGALIILVLTLIACKASVNTQTGDQATSLKDILSNRNTKYTAEYIITSSNMTQNLMMVSDWPKFVEEVNTPQGVARFIYDGAILFICVNVQDSWQCYQSNFTAEQKAQAFDAANEIQDKIKRGKIVPAYVGTCSVAGLTGFKYQLVDQGSTQINCYTSDGILLEGITANGTMIATKITRSVDSSLFILPATPQDMSKLYPNG